MLDVVVIGGGPAGLAAAISAKENGAKSILIIERSDKLGGILSQCIHNGFGLHTFKEELTGPEYAARFIDMVEEHKIPYILNSTVIDVKPHEVVYINERDGVVALKANAIVLAMGCRERPRGALNIPGDRPSGIFSAGTAQHLVNIEGIKLGRKAIILGSGDIGLIMARRMTLEGAEVAAVIEIMPYSSGLKRNIVQCLDDFGIPLYLSHTITRIEGKKHLEGVVVSEVDENRRPIKGSEIHFDVDTLLLSVGLLPENELSRKASISLSAVTGGPIADDDLETDADGIFACGNVLHVHDLVDYVTEEAIKAGRSAALYRKHDKELVDIKTSGIVRYTVPERIRRMPDDDITIRFRVSGEVRDGKIAININGKTLLEAKRRIMAPGEMETIVLKKALITEKIESIEVGAGL